MKYRIGYAFIACSTICVVLIFIFGEYVYDLNLMPKNIFRMFKERKAETPNEITIVTMYLDIGRFQKGNGHQYFTPDTYKNWMKTWGWLTNRVIGFFDNSETLELFRKMRSSQPEDKTVLIKLNRKDIFAFRDLEKVRQIFASPNYPKHSPNTVVAEYSCAMNAKYEALQLAMVKGLVPTNYMAWLDIGLFRNLLNLKIHPTGDSFTLEVPNNFSSTSVAMSEVSLRNDMSKYGPWDYIKNNMVWVSGAFLLGTKEKMWTFSESYKWTLNKLTEQNMSSTDQQVIGAMYSPAYSHLQTVDIQGYRCQSGQFGIYGFDTDYFCLGYVCKDAAEKRQNISLRNILSLQDKP